MACRRRSPCSTSLAKCAAPGARLYEALETATASASRSAHDRHLDAELQTIKISYKRFDHRRRARRPYDPSTMLRLDVAPEEADPFDEADGAASPTRRCTRFMNVKEVLAQAPRRRQTDAERASRRSEIWCSTSGSRPRSRSSPMKYGWRAPASPPISRAAKSMRGSIFPRSLNNRACLDRPGPCDLDMERSSRRFGCPSKGSWKGRRAIVRVL